MAVVHVPACLSDLSEAHRLSGEGLADEVPLLLELDSAALVDQAHFEVRVVLDARQPAGIGPEAGRVARARHLVSQRFVRPLEVVHGPIAVELALYLPVVMPDRPLADDLQLERAMEALILALGLGVKRSAVLNRDAEADEPGREAGVQTLAARSLPV